MIEITFLVYAAIKTKYSGDGCLYMDGREPFMSYLIDIQYPKSMTLPQISTPTRVNRGALTELHPIHLYIHIYVHL